MESFPPSSEPHAHCRRPTEDNAGLRNPRWVRARRFAPWAVQVGRGCPPVSGAPASRSGPKSHPHRADARIVRPPDQSPIRTVRMPELSAHLQAGHPPLLPHPHRSYGRRGQPPRVVQGCVGRLWATRRVVHGLSMQPSGTAPSMAHFEATNLPNCRLPTDRYDLRAARVRCWNNGAAGPNESRCTAPVEKEADH